jgi:hypothetical protein
MDVDRVGVEQWPNNSMRRTALRAAADTERWVDKAVMNRKEL